MWQATVTRLGGESESRRVPQQSGALPSSRGALNLFLGNRRQLPPDLSFGRLLNYLEAEAEDEGRSDFSSSRNAVQQVRLRAAVENDGESIGTEMWQAALAMSHLPTTVIVPIVGDEAEFDLVYDVGSVKRHVSGLQPWDGYTLDWRAYLGSGTAILDGRTGRYRNRQGFPRLRFKLRGLPHLPGFLIGSVLRHTGRRFDLSFKSDPTYQKRRRLIEDAEARLARQIPDLESATEVSLPSATIYVHGTRSHGLEGLRDLNPLDSHQARVFRYEHDTFLPVASNGEQLADLINRKVKTSFLTILAHSRGGLVARFARLRLEKLKYPARINICTFGTPHQGTPIINCLEQNVALLFRLGKVGVLGLPELTRLDYVLSCLTNIHVLPEGVSFMSEGSHGLATLNYLDEPTGVECWGSNFDLNDPQGGYGLFLDSLLSGILSGTDNDLIVPTASALGFGTSHPVLSCGHSGYFREDLVRAAIRSACPGVLQ